MNEKAEVNRINMSLHLQGRVFITEEHTSSKCDTADSSPQSPQSPSVRAASLIVMSSIYRCKAVNRKLNE